MCGIYFSCSRGHAPDLGVALRTCLDSRGPDSSKVVQRNIQSPNIPKGRENATYPPLILQFLSTVLSLRSDVVVQQPLIDPVSSSILCWNGEAWTIDGNIVVGNDATAVLDVLVENTHLHADRENERDASNGSNLDRVIESFSRIAGPYSFVYYDAYNGHLFYGRDILGRRSLLVKANQHDLFAVSSVCDPENAGEWTEVEPNSIHVLDVYAIIDKLHPDQACSFPGYSSMTSPRNIKMLSPLNRSEPHNRPVALSHSSASVTSLAYQLDNSLRLRVRDIPSSIPRQHASRPRFAILFSGGLDCTLLARLVHDIVPFDQEIDLLNVAFENPRISRAAVEHDQGLSNNPTPYARCPDRVTSISSHFELMKTCPERMWRLVTIDIPYSETMEHRNRIISLIKPHNTEMDLSIACALYFAARGKGFTCNSAQNTSHAYTSSARVLLSGLGADELFGGYQRHATAYHRKGHSALIEELELDISRLGKRNLGRDDRVISHWGKEVRYPYLDELLVTWALSLPIWEKCDFGVRPDLEGESKQVLEPSKKLLRLLAWNKGLHHAAVEKKRAIQFGARTARMESGKVKGTEVLY